MKQTNARKEINKHLYANVEKQQSTKEENQKAIVTALVFFFAIILFGLFAESLTNIIIK